MYKKKGARVAGVGVNDADYVIVKREGKKEVWICPFYAAWRNMLNRVYSGRYKNYLDCSVCDEWLLFSNFKSWMEVQNHQGLHLDKDIKIQGSKTYSPQTCAFVPARLNSLLSLSSNSKGEEPVGVCFRKDMASRPYQSYCNSFETDKRTHLGYFQTAEEAHKEWQISKADQILKAVFWYEQQGCYTCSVAEALRGRVVKLIQQSLRGEETTEI